MQSLKNLFHLFEAVCANLWFGFPSKKITVIGVTGTDGKTTTTHLISHILKQNNRKVSMISTIFAQIGAERYETGLHTTTPRPFMIQSLLKKAVDTGDEFFVLETTSHALDQNRVYDVHFGVSVVTNITPEHLDYHGTYDEYLAAKARMFFASDISILNKDDESFTPLSKLLYNKKVATYSITQKSDYIYPRNLNNPLEGDYNKSNIMAAYAVCGELDFPQEAIEKAIATFTLPHGRLDIVYDRKFMYIIDFAHTTNAVGRVLDTVREEFLKKPGRIIHVFGSAGLRDRAKRAGMGRKSGKRADIIIVTEEDYRTEDFNAIADQICEGIMQRGWKRISSLGDLRDICNLGNKKTFTVIQDRQEAINFAVSIASLGDIIISTGKGHEKSLARGKKEYEWDEYEAVKNALKILHL